MTGLLSVERLHPLDAESVAMLDRAAREAKAVFGACLHAPPDARAAILERRSFLFRRWALEVVLVAGFRGPLAHGDLKRALAGGKDVPSGSLSPKLRELQDAGILDRTETGDAQGRVLYAIAPRAASLADAVYALTSAKAHQTMRVRSGATAPDVGGFGGPGSIEPPEGGLDEALDAYAEAARAFAAHHAARQTPAGFETSIESATRFAEACDRKWQGLVMMALLQRPGPFNALRRAVGLGDQALSLALRELQASRTIQRGDDGVYRLAPYAFYDMSFGVSALALLERLSRSTPPAYPG